MTEILLAISTGLIAMLSWGTGDFLAKKTIDKIGDYASLFWGHIYGSFALLIIFSTRVFIFHSNFHVPENSKECFFLVFFGALQAIIYILLYRGFGKGQLSILNTIFASYSGLTVVLSIFFFNEKVTLYLSLSLVALFVGIVLMNLDSTDFKKGKITFVKTLGLIEILSATLLAAIWTILWSNFVGSRDAFAYSLYMYLIMTVAISFWCLLKNVKLRGLNGSIWFYCGVIGILESIAYLAISTGYRWTHHTSIVALLSGAFSLPVLILSRIFLREFPSRIQYLGIALVIISIMLLSLT